MWDERDVIQFSINNTKNVFKCVYVNTISIHCDSFVVCNGSFRPNVSSQQRLHLKALYNRQKIPLSANTFYLGHVLLYFFNVILLQVYNRLKRVPFP